MCAYVHACMRACVCACVCVCVCVCVHQGYSAGINNYMYMKKFLVGPEKPAIPDLIMLALISREYA